VENILKPIYIHTHTKLVDDPVWVKVSSCTLKQFAIHIAGCHVSKLYHWKVLPSFEPIFLQYRGLEKEYNYYESES